MNVLTAAQVSPPGAGSAANACGGPSAARRRRTLLRLSDGSFARSIVARNAVNRVLAMDLDGFFSSVLLAFFKADADAEHPLSPRHTVMDIAVVPPGSGKLGAVRAELGFMRRAVGLVRRHGVVALQANDPYVSGLNALILSRLTGLPYVIEIVDAYDLSQKAGSYRYIPYLPSREWEKKVEWLVLRNANAVYAQSQFYLNYALANRARPERTCQVRCVTSPFYYTAAPQKPLSAYAPTGGRRTLFYFGGLRPCKNVLDLVDCLAKVRSSGEDVCLLIAGDGPERPLMERRAEELGVRGAMVLLGHRSAQELVDLMHGADVLLATHAGYALLEMGLSGKPIVAFDYEWHPEVVRHEQTGLLARYRDGADMGEQVLRLLRAPAWGRQLGQACREFVLANHDQTGAMQDERRIYSRLLAQ
jgi:glycosyltransferase involved in cell wall biosynthesis